LNKKNENGNEKISISQLLSYNASFISQWTKSHCNFFSLRLASVTKDTEKIIPLHFLFVWIEKVLERIILLFCSSIIFCFFQSKNWYNISSILIITEHSNWRESAVNRALDGRTMEVLLRGRLSTFYLLVLTGLNQLIFILKILFSFLQNKLP
jgi:hypothetical protein